MTPALKEEVFHTFHIRVAGAHSLWSGILDRESMINPFRRNSCKDKRGACHNNHYHFLLFQTRSSSTIFPFILKKPVFALTNNNIRLFSDREQYNTLFIYKHKKTRGEKSSWSFLTLYSQRWLSVIEPVLVFNSSEAAGELPTLPCTCAPV